MKYFGQSLQGNVDVDGNGYPDLFIGAPKSDSLVVLKYAIYLASHFFGFRILPYFA